MKRPTVAELFPPAAKTFCNPAKAVADMIKQHKIAKPKPIKPRKKG